MDAAGLTVEQQALRLAFEATAPRLGGMSFDAFAAGLRDFEVHPVLVRGRLCGAVLVRGPEIHACVLPAARGRWFGREQASLLNRVIEEHGEATTSATTEEGRLFVERLGFVNDNGIYRSHKKWALSQSSR
jgi:GNAT superfamily N-acetyltransferase